MKTAHTPGPCAQHHPPYYAGDGRQITDENNKVIASYVDPENAPLIAAAPELLADLTFLLESIHLEGLDAKCGGTVLAALQNAKRSIAKAEGK